MSSRKFMLTHISDADIWQMVGISVAIVNMSSSTVLV